MIPSSARELARYLSLAAAVAIALACGTNYVYSAYAPQLAEKLHLSATETNVIGTFGNLGMYVCGIPAGMLVDSRGPRIPILIGAASMFTGYYPIYWAFEHGKGSMSVAALSFFSAITGMGSCFAFMAAIKVAALNFPAHRGTATALPLAAFGLSAFFFSTLSHWLFPGNTGDFLLVLAIATSCMIFVSWFFIRIVPVPGTYSAVPDDDPDGLRGSTSRLHRRKSSSSGSRFEAEPGTKATEEEQEQLVASSSRASAAAEAAVVVDTEARAERESLMSSSSESSTYGSEDNARRARSGSAAAANAADVERRGNVDDHATPGAVDIRGWALTKHWEFWRLWCLLGLLTGTGLMTINNIGHDVQALWFYKDPKIDPHFVQKQQALHVSILSLCSFAGRLCSGVLSDVFKRKWHLSRLWQVLISCVVFFIAQVAGLSVSNPDGLWMLSSLNGFGYGIVFGVFPTIISEVFGVLGLSQNWGTMTLAPVVSGNIFNLFYGSVYDSHSTRRPSGERECNFGVDCYRASYGITSISCFLAFVLCLVCIKMQQTQLRGRALFRD